MTLFHPHKPDRTYPDERSRQVMLDLVEFFEAKGKARLKEDDHAAVWYRTSSTSSARRASSPRCAPRRATAPTTPAGTPGAICEFAEILGFYGLPYWYTWQVSVLGLGPIWMSDNEAVKETHRQLLAGRRHLRLRAVREGARRRPLLLAR